MSEEVIGELKAAIESKDSKRIADAIRAVARVHGESRSAYEAFSLGACGLVKLSDADGISRFFECYAESADGHSMGDLLAVAKSHEQAANWMRGQFGGFVGDIYVRDLLTGRLRKFEFDEEET